MTQIVKGAVSTSLMITIGTLLVSGIFGGIAFVEARISASVEPVRADIANITQQTNTNTANIEGLQTDVKWIRDALNNNGIRPRQ